MNEILITFKPEKKNIKIDSNTLEIIKKLRDESVNNQIKFCKAFLLSHEILSQQYPDYANLFKDLKGLRTNVWHFEKDIVGKNRYYKLIEYNIAGYEVYMGALVEYLVENSGDGDGYYKTGEDDW